MDAAEFMRVLASGTPQEKTAALNYVTFHGLEGNLDEKVIGRIYTNTSLHGLPELPLAMSRILFQMQCSAQNGAAEPNRLGLGDWMFAPFQDPSLLLSSRSRNKVLRDEYSTIELALRMGPDWPVKRDVSPAWEDAWQKVGNDIVAICVIGRLGLFGQAMVDHLTLSDAQFRFPQQLRGESDVPDPAYYRIIERPCLTRTRCYQFTEDQESRTDYAIVHRHTVANSKKMAVVHIAGTTALGSLGAARWASQDLFRPAQYGAQSPICVPEGIKDDSRMEALIKVTARRGNPADEIDSISVVRLRVDGREWLFNKSAWSFGPTHWISYVDDSSVEPFYFDGWPTTLSVKNQNGRLLRALVQQKAQSGSSQIDLERLINNKAIWDASAVGEEQAVRRLKDLSNRHLGNALHVGNQITLTPQVEIVPPSQAADSATGHSEVRAAQLASPGRPR